MAQPPTVTAISAAERQGVPPSAMPTVDGIVRGTDRSVRPGGVRATASSRLALPGTPLSDRAGTRRPRFRTLPGAAREREAKSLRCPTSREEERPYSLGGAGRSGVRGCAVSQTDVGNRSVPLPRQAMSVFGGSSAAGREAQMRNASLMCGSRNPVPDHDDVELASVRRRVHGGGRGMGRSAGAC